MKGVYFDEERKLRCDCINAGWVDEFVVSITEDGKIVISCPECISQIELDGVSIALPTPREMTITKEQAKYWTAVALKNIKEDNIHGAQNVFRWLMENEAKGYADKVAVALLEASK